jgi:hypothetical protein
VSKKSTISLTGFISPTSRVKLPKSFIAVNLSDAFSFEQETPENDPDNDPDAPPAATSAAEAAHVEDASPDEEGQAEPSPAEQGQPEDIVPV